MKKWIPTVIFIMTIVLVLGGCSVGKNTSNEKFSSFSSSGKEPESSSDDVNVRTFESTGPRAWDAKFQVISSDKGNIWLTLVNMTTNFPIILSQLEV
ncbi:hypothetical protein LMU08_002984 [Listeria monocytogenes]|nr:hypothetical protein [Listeria monocytogenes]EAG4727510.1 hypothetical protein [Listeria monocytogenes]EAG5553907.1 hypothetical protein [Listeria monocytogenes]ECC0367822.1 hypothetical protein [Listeria monocytogenes]ECC0539812.1 hypothetical protein [Listeria monocytogenes]